MSNRPVGFWIEFSPRHLCSRYNLSEFFLKSAIQFAVTELDIKLIVFDVEQEAIVQWIG